MFYNLSAGRYIVFHLPALDITHKVSLLRADQGRRGWVRDRVQNFFGPFPQQGLTG
jgi:hypothetical protein